MSVTFSGAFTFTGGGFTATLAPTGATAGWLAGGKTVSTVNRITYATDTSTASVRGPLSSARYNPTGVSTLTYGWNAGGASSGVTLTTVDRITYATDTDIASVRGPLSVNTYNAGSTSDGTTYGWIGGGFSNTPLSTVQRITYATDTATTTSRGPLSLARYGINGTGTPYYGWYIGGKTLCSTIDRITYATDTATASVRGSMSYVTCVAAGTATDSSTYGWYAGGSVAAPVYRISTVSRITYATDTDIASVRGPLNAARYNGTGGDVCDNTYGWFGGGYSNAPGSLVKVSSVTRITYATDTATSTDRGPLSAANNYMAGTSGLQ